MNVAEIKAKLPCADVYEFGPGFTYLILFDKNQVPRMLAEMVVKDLDRSMGRNVSYQGSRFLMVMCEDPSEAIRILEVKV